MTDLETRLRENLRASAEDVAVSLDAWQQNQRRLATADARRKTSLFRGASVATAAVAVGLMAVVVLGNGTDRDKRESDRVPADPVPVRSSALLLPEELPPVGDEWRPVADGSGEGERMDECQRQAFRALGATQASHRTFIADDAEPVETARQAVARYPSAEAAADAFRSVRESFENCSDVLATSGARSGIVKHGGGRFALVAYSALQDTPGTDYSLVWAGVAIHSHTVTVVSIAKSSCCEPDEIRLDTLMPTMRVALDRLSERRTWTADAVPEGFQFAEQQGGETRWENLHSLWHLDEAACGQKAVPGDDVRTGMVAVAPDGLTLQLAVYPDTQTAASVAEALHAELAKCAAGASQSVQTVTTSTGRQKVYLDFNPKNAYGVVSGLSIVQFGRAVFLADVAPYPGDKASLAARKALALREVQKSIERNKERICQISGC